MAPIAHVMTWSAKNWALAHPCAMQFEIHTTLNDGGNDEKSRQVMNAQETIS